MRYRALPVLLTLALGPLLGCDDGGSDPSGPPDLSAEDADLGAQRDLDAQQEDLGAQADTAPDVDLAGPDLEPDAQLEDGGLTDLGAEDIPLRPLGTLQLPQAIAGALWANPEVQPNPGLLVRVANALQVSVRLDEGAWLTADPAGEDWQVTLPLAELPAGVHRLEVRAQGEGEQLAEGSWELGLGAQGVRLTAWEELGAADNPRLHRGPESLWLSWVDHREGGAAAWLQGLDGAGRRLGQPLRLTHPDERALHARVALGRSWAGVLYQLPGEPYQTRFRRVALSGEGPLEAPLDLDPEGYGAAFGGDLAFDGEAFVAAWRVTDAAGKGEVRWLRVREEDGELTGPLLVAAAGDGAETGGFEPFSFVRVAANPERSLVSFCRADWIPLLEQLAPKSHLARIDAAGVLSPPVETGLVDDLTWHRESHVFRDGEGFLSLWTMTNLMGSEGSRQFVMGVPLQADGLLPEGRARGVAVVDALGDRDEPWFTAHPRLRGVLAWMDHRSYEDSSPGPGQIELYVAPLSEQLRAGRARVYGHARVFSGLAQLRGALAGPNVLLVWVDQRESRGIMDPRPELYFETVWF